MNRAKILLLALALVVAGILVLNVMGMPGRVPDEEQAQRDRVDTRLDQIHAERASDEALVEDAVDAAIEEVLDDIVEEVVEEVTETVETASPETPTDGEEADMWPETAPDVFRVTFECTNGEFVVECYKDWAPLGVERFYQLVREEFFDNTGFFRVVPGFVVQFGLAADPEVTAEWRVKPLQDDPVQETNAPGTLTFATSGPNSRTTQLFINLGNNARLDDMGFAPFGRVVEGMDVVESINDQYRERPQQPLIMREGTSYLRANFPEMDFINTARLTQ